MTDADNDDEWTSLEDRLNGGDFEADEVLGYANMPANGNWKSCWKHETKNVKEFEQWCQDNLDGPYHVYSNSSNIIWIVVVEDTDYMALKLNYD